MSTVTMPIPHPMKPIFPHEGTVLFQRARALHAYAARLAAEPDAPTGRRALKRAAKSAFVTIATAGTAVSENACAAVLRRTKTWLSRCSAEIAALLDEGSITRDVARFARSAVHSVETELSALPTALAMGNPIPEQPFEDEGSDPAAGHLRGDAESPVDGAGTPPPERERDQAEPSTCRLSGTPAIGRSRSRQPVGKHVMRPAHTSTSAEPSKRSASDRRESGKE